ncbi:hypothetical protein CQ13_08635 [Bradyrhizobium retamae]|uniref:Uncharacterized protein n=2 Tax=Bradyrhizobium retamae TaxID=1300035 RepID=A0A0R3MID0_9BRAD|nr:hypothetical protein CQ13_08635 [Bradyrhizobium retamae]
MKFVPALLACIVAGTNLATVTDLRAQSAEQQVAEARTRASQAAADNCLSAPKGATPSGSHWYYRIDRTTRRQCWYLREENEKADDKFARAAPPQSVPAASSAEVPPQMETRKSFDDARAEWVAQQARAEQNPPAKAEPQTAGAAPTDQNGPRANMPNVLAPAPLATMRWNDAPAASASTNPTNLQVAAAATPANQPVQAEEVQQPAADQTAPLAAEPAKPTASLQKLLLVMAAALALAGLTVSAIVRIGRMRARRAMRRKRHAMWDAARTKRPAPPVFHDEDARLRRTGAVQHTRVPKERPRVPQERARAPQERVRVPQERARIPQERVRAPQERARVPQERERDQQVTEMLARLARSAQT